MNIEYLMAQPGPLYQSFAQIMDKKKIRATKDVSLHTLKKCHSISIINYIFDYLDGGLFCVYYLLQF